MLGASGAGQRVRTATGAARHVVTIQAQIVCQFLDIVPVRASKGLALRWCAGQLGIPLENILAAGGSGADEDMMLGNTMAVVVANRHHEELSMADTERIYFAERGYAAGIIEAIAHYHFFDAEA